MRRRAERTPGVDDGQPRPRLTLNLQERAGEGELTAVRGEGHRPDLCREVVSRVAEREREGVVERSSDGVQAGETMHRGAVGELAGTVHHAELASDVQRCVVGAEGQIAYLF